MRVVSVLFALTLALGFVTGIASADKGIKSDEPTWQYELYGVRSIIPEQEPNNTCPGQAMALGDVIDPARIDVAGDVDWYTFTVTDLLPFTVGTDASPTCDPDASDTYISLYSSDCTTILANDDDSGPGFYSLINWTPSYVGTYNVKVRHYSSSGTGCYKFFAQGTATGACCLAGGICQVLTQAQCGTQGGTYMGDNIPCEPNPCPQPPPNDRCDGAIALERCQVGFLEGNTSAAVNDYNPGIPGPSCTGYPAAAKDVAYILNLVAGDLVHLVYTTPAYDGSMYIVTDCSNVSASCVIGEDDPEPETINWTVPATGIYYLILDGYAANAGGAFTLDWSITCPPPLEACCFPDGHCEMLTTDACTQAGGTAQGAGSLCDPNPCVPAPGACCFQDGHCEMQIADVCTAMGGVFQGIGVLCDPNPCPQPPMACCFADGTCQFVTEQVCLEMGGVPQGFGTVCDPNPCPQPTGACCVGYDCSIVTETECAAMGGQYYGDGSLCDPNPCPPPPATGACCLDIYGNCEVMTQEACQQAGGVYQGDDIPCDPNPCPITPAKSTTWGKIKGDYR